MTAHFNAAPVAITVLEIGGAVGEGKYLKAAAMAAPYVALALSGPLMPLVAAVTPLAAAVLGGLAEDMIESNNIRKGEAYAAAHPAKIIPEPKHPKIKWVNLNAGKPGMAAHWVGEKD